MKQDIGLPTFSFQFLTFTGGINTEVCRLLIANLYDFRLLIGGESEIASNTCINFYCIQNLVYNLWKIRLLIEIQSKACVLPCLNLLQCNQILNISFELQLIESSNMAN